MYKHTTAVWHLLRRIDHLVAVIHDRLDSKVRYPRGSCFIFFYKWYHFQVDSQGVWLLGISYSDLPFFFFLGAESLCIFHEGNCLNNQKLVVSCTSIRIEQNRRKTMRGVRMGQAKKRVELYFILSYIRVIWKSWNMKRTTTLSIKKAGKNN